jgi:hypothetical protein
MPDDPKQPPSVPRGENDVRTGTTPTDQQKDDPSTAPESGDRKATG